MYVPEPFRAAGQDELFEVMARHSFATLVTAAGGVPLATWAPFVVRREPDGRHRLWGHIARANPQGRVLDPGREVLVIFQGPHHYISPSWYADAPNVPTWNFVVVHAYGTPRELAPEDPRTRWILEQTVAQHEAAMERPWRLDSASAYVEKLIGGVRAFEIELSRVEGQFKLSQNHSAENRRGVIAGLERCGDDAARDVAALMRERERDDGAP
jgi:transcriptional regulator